MGQCRYCHENAGWFRRQHSDCQRAHARAVAEIDRMGKDAALRGRGLDTLLDDIRRVAAAGRVDVGGSAMQDILVRAWGLAVDESLEDGVFKPEERQNLNRFRVHFGLGEDILNRAGHFDTFRMMHLIGMIQNNEQIPRFDRRAARARFGRFPFNLMKSEEMVWVFREVPYYEQVTTREFQGSSLGVSVRVAKGVYLRPGAFRGRTVSSSSMQRTDTGTMGITTKHIYFGGTQKAFRVRLDRIVSIMPYSDGLGIMRDRARAKPEHFGLTEHNVWFAANLVEAIQSADDLALPGSDDGTLDDIVGAMVTGDAADIIDDDDDDDDDDDGNLVPVSVLGSS